MLKKIIEDNVIEVLIRKAGIRLLFLLKLYLKDI